MDAEIIQELRGHSGCKIYVCNNGKSNGFFVRKIAGGVDYNRRLELQCTKQRRYADEVFGVRVPCVLGTGYTAEGCFFMDMEYVKGETWGMRISHTSVTEIRRQMEFLLTPIMKKRTMSASPGDVHAIFMQKIVQLREALQSNNDEINDALDMLACMDYSCVPGSLCYGDLSMENVLITDVGELYVLDISDSFFDSWMLDVSKFLFDIDSGWSYRDNGTPDNVRGRLLYLRNALQCVVYGSEDGIRLSKVLPALELMQCLRIFPYVKDDRTRTLLQHALSILAKQTSL